MDKIRVGLVGVGGMGGCHFYNYEKIEGAELVAVCDVRKDVAKEKVGDRNINIYTKLDKMLENEKLDMIDICTPSFLHKDMTIKLLEKGYHVLCEKPMTLNAKDAQKVVEAANKTDKKFMVAHVVRFMAPYSYLKSVIKSEELGKLIRLDMKRLSGIPTWSWEDWMRNEKRSGGVATDLSIHDIDFVQSVLGEPDSFQAYRYNMKDNNDTVVTNMTYGDVLVSCEGTWYNASIPFHATYIAVFQNGYLELKDNGKLYKNGNEINLSQSSAAENVELGINVGNDDGYYKEMQYFVNCIITDKKPDLVTPESSALSVAIVDKIKKKAKKLK